MERIIKLELSEEEEELLDTLVKHCKSIGFQEDSENVLSNALFAGSKWDTYVYDKLASYLLLMGGCEYEEYDNLISTHKQQLDNEYKQVQAEKNAQRVSEEKVVKKSEFKEQVDCDSADYQSKTAKVQNIVKQLYEAQSVENIGELEPEQ